MKTKIYLIGLLMISSVFFSFMNYQVKPWLAPEKNARERNPVKRDTESIKVGKDIWIRHCGGCHGRQGAGDGVQSGSVKTFMKDMGTSPVQGQTDGALFYKISAGRGEMPGYKGKIS
ncbi:MAG TPA: c-type cytochrome, partial [Cyclobacteriaceae bacterium]|nr:c-type cytochrome [Cyclobacteriaceae bacterium]